MNNNEIREYRQDLQNRVIRIETILERVESHLDNLKDCVDQQIVIDKKEGV